MHALQFVYEQEYELVLILFFSDMIACPELMNPENGQVDNNGMTENSTATYSCDNGYTLNGPLTRTCSSDGVWSESEPSCQSKKNP